jgi:hypothetical protein
MVANFYKTKYILMLNITQNLVPLFWENHEGIIESISQINVHKLLYSIYKCVL